ncbi:YhdP family protein [Accumulibacter sp.]|uniref:YhdP family protein n=1 Tax=Accumulibacter sp. TaxID=2053492 RepID=UPI0026370F92|nr:YhdP family protein [Accumulibacter sp.]
MRQEELRPALYHRLHWLLPVVSHPAARTIGRLVGRSLWLLYFAFVLTILALRHLVLPNIESYRPAIERQLSQALGLSVAIGRIAASWDGLNPDLTLSDVRIADARGQPALAFARVEGVLSWSSVARWQLRLRRLQIDEPTLHLRRDTDGSLYVAGIAVSHAAGDGAIADWVLAQQRIRVNGATVVWEDARRDAPPLILEDVNFALDNHGRQHRFGLTALPPAELASRIDLRGDFRGKAVEDLASWQGQAFAQIDYADLAVWRAWLDYPLALPHGRGAVRAWAAFAEGSLRELTADLALRGVSLRLAKDLPALELDHMSGRLGARFLPTGASLDGRRVELVTSSPAAGRNSAASGIRIPPTDFHVDWQHQPGASVRGSATANALELGAFAALAGHLPLDAGSRQLLDDFAPRGRISELRATWDGKADGLLSYSLKTRFDALALRPQGSLPGVSGLSGWLEANELGGSVNLRSEKVDIDLPTVFPESSIALDTLNAQGKWKISQGRVDAELARAEFASPDAAGLAQGTFRYTGDGPGSIDLSAALSRADARAVWRYLPGSINTAARHWVRDALKKGVASEAKLILKGDLAHFPFLDPRQGQFLVTVKANDVTLDYGTGWPMITGIDADLKFVGAGMVVEARRGAILGANLSQTRAEIPDFDAPVSMLKVKGRVEGETAEFLKYVAQSPVAAQIDHFTENMSASGKGRLDIGLSIPLEEARLGESKIEGNYVFVANEVTVDPALPPLRQVNGSLAFSEKDLRIPEISAVLFGGPVRIKGGAQGGKVMVVANGSLGMDELRRRLEWPLLDALSGTAAYRLEVGSRKRNVELVVDSNLVGVASSLSPPFAKSASEALPMHFESSMLPPVPSRGGQPVARDQIRLTLGNLLNMQLIRRKQGDDSLPERGAVTVGRPLPPLPERGIQIGVSARSLDLDYWQRMLRSATKAGASASPPSWPISVDLKADELVILGKYYNEVTATVSSAAPLWRGTLQSREAVGSFQWDGAGAGKLAAHFKRWRRPDKESVNSQPAEVLKELPALDIVVDDFVVGVRRFGRLEVQAHNEAGIWRLDKIDILNPFGRLSGSGQWQLANGNRTQLDFALHASDAGKLLDRLGYLGAVRGAGTTLEGRIGWNGSPAALDYSSLSGDMKLEVGKGQFVKLDPGAAGKLLGLISLQGLPRRLSLDFGDVFSEGFAFDSIGGKMTVKDGLMRTSRLQIDGPSARVVMRGETDLKQETQHLNVTVQPELGGSAALGVAVVNPLAGVATLLAHKVLQNPLNKIFSFDYLVTGTWDDPKVERAPAAPAPAATTP